MGETSIEYRIGGEPVEDTVLYITSPEEDEADAADPRAIDAERYSFELDESFIDDRAETAFPTLYQPGNAKGTILIIGMKGCGWCITQMKAIPGVVVERDGDDLKVVSSIYRVLYVKASDHDPLNTSDNPKPWDYIREKNELSKSYPTTFIVVKGQIVKHFTGMKPWKLIEPHVTTCKLETEKDTNDDEEDTEDRRRFIDLFFRNDPEPTPAIKRSRFMRAIDSERKLRESEKA